MISQKRSLTLHKALRLFLAFAALDGLICTAILFAIPSDSQTSWLLGYSRARVLMLAASLAGVLFFAGLFVRFQGNNKRTISFTDRIDKLLQEDRWATLFLGSLSFIFVLALINMIFSYTNLDYRVPKDAVTSMEQVKAYLYRLAPFFVWLWLLSAQALVLLTLVGVGTRARYEHVLSAVAIVIFPLLFLVFRGFDRIDPYYYVTVTKEDNLVEWLTVLFFWLAALFSFVRAFQAYRQGSRYSLFYLLLGIACILFLLEEISWGQRIFGVKSTEFFMENSDQQEINVHNVINERFSIRTKHVAAFVMLLYGVVLPLLALNTRLRALIEKLRIVVPPKVLIPGFSLAAFMTVDRFFTGQDEEVAEFFFSLCLFLVVLFSFVKSNQDIAVNVPPSSQQ